MQKYPFAIVCVLLIGCFFLYECAKVENATTELVKAWNEPPLPVPPIPPTSKPTPRQTFEKSFHATILEHAKKNASVYIRQFIPADWAITEVSAVDNDPETEPLGVVRYSILVVVEVRFQTPYGYMKRYGSFACDESGTVLQPLSLPEP